MKKRAFIGGYTSSAETCGIRKVAVDTESGALLDLGLVANIDNPIYFALNAARTRLYVAQGDIPGRPRSSNGAIAVYEICGESLNLLDKRVFPYSIPCHISLSHDGRALVFAEYSGANFGVIGLSDDGRFEKNAPVCARHEGSGPNPIRQEAAHAHCALTSPDDQLLFVCDLGLDRVFAYDFASWRNGLRRVSSCDIVTAPGAGPRHLVFSGNGKYAYLVNELFSTVQVLEFDGRSFRPLQTLSMLPPGEKCITKAAAIRLSEDGRWLLASNRGHDSIAAFRVASGGTLSSPVVSGLTGSFPRDFAFVPGTDIVLVGHKMSDELATYRFDPQTGGLRRLEVASLATERPLAIAFF